MTKKLILTSVYFLVVLFVHAQLRIEASFNNLPFENLHQKEILDYVWDDNGLMYLGTDKGLVTYNGYSTNTILEFKTDKKSLLSKGIYRLFIDSKEYLWVTYYDVAGLTRYNLKTGDVKNFIPDSTQKDILPEVLISKIYEDSKHNFWLLTWGKGLIKFDREKGKVTQHFEFDPEDIENNRTVACNFMQGMAELSDGKYFISYFEELNKSAYPAIYDPQTGIFKPFSIDEYTTHCSEEERLKIKTASRIVHFVHVQDDDNIWLGTYSGILHMDRKNKKIQRISGKSFTDKIQNLDNAENFVVDKNNLMWVSTPNSGILLVDLNSKRGRYLVHNPKLHSSVADNRIVRVKKDRFENIWVSVKNKVFSIYTPFAQQFNLNLWEDFNLDFTNRSIQVIPVNQLLVNKNSTVYISNNNGLLLYDISSKKVIDSIVPSWKITRANIKNQQSVVGSFKNLNDRIMMMSHSDLYYFDKLSRKIIPVNEGAKGTSLLFRHSDFNSAIVYIVYPEKELRLYYPQENRSEILMTLPEGVAIKENFTLQLKSGNWLLSGGEQEFYIFNPKNKSFTTYSSKEAKNYFPDSTIQVGYLDKEGTVWFGTKNGLYRFDENSGRAELMNETIGISSEPVNAIIIDNKNVLWLALSKEIYRYDFSSKEKFRFGNVFGLYPGSFLPSIAQTDDSGRIYMVGINGFVDFHPDNLKLPTKKPILKIDKFYINESLVSWEEIKDLLNEERSLAYNQNNFIIEFFSDEIATPAEHVFYYRLKGFDDKWKENGTSNRIELISIPYGQYTLEVKIINAYGKESDILKIPIHIRKPFWFTIWFYLCIAVFLGVIVFIYIRYREKKLVKQKKVLEDKVEERTKEVILQAEELKEKSHIIEEKNKELTDSIKYAHRIQSAILPSGKLIKENLKEAFVLYKPKDIVAGDFYWMDVVNDEKENKISHVIFAAADCTGHGVPGAMVSVICHNALNRSVREFGLLNPAEILNKTRELVIEEFSKSDEEVKDGMDISLCSLEVDSNKLTWAGANNPLWIIRKKDNEETELVEIKADKQPIGKYEHAKPFTSHEISLNKNDTIYIFSDGYQDQFGGPNGKKFKASQLKELILEIAQKPLVEQGSLLDDRLENWRGTLEQVDDICFIGVKF